MRRLLKWLGTAVLILAAAVLAAFLLVPGEPVETEISFDASTLPADLDTWLSEREARVLNLRDGVAKRIVWADAPGEATDYAVVYLHGFSATSEEIRPVPDNLAAALGANLHFARLAGHGRDGDAMAEPTAGDWIEDTAEALAIGRRIGGRVIVIATSTGGTLAALAATHPELKDDIAGIIFVSPNFALNNPAAPILTWPWARHWAPLVAGAERSFTTINAGHAKYWTSRYPTVAVLPMAALVAHVRQLEFGQTDIPAMFLLSEQDRVVSPDATTKVFQSWGGEKILVKLVMQPGDDPYNHVIAGDIMSPAQTEIASDRMINWAKGL